VAGLVMGCRTPLYVVYYHLGYLWPQSIIHAAT
jgi:hypothetical protein